MNWEIFLKMLDIVGNSIFLCAVCKYGYKAYKLNKCGCDN